MQILIPVSGTSTFFPKDEYYFPKPLVEVAGKPMIELVVEQLQQSFAEAHFLFVIDSEDARSFSLDKTLRLIAGSNATIIERAGQTAGALCSSLLAIDALDPNQALIISNSDQIIEGNLSLCVDVFRESKCSAGVITFESVHPRWSYVVDDGHGIVLQAFEKKVASRKAIAGFYYFESATIFCDAAMQSITNGAEVGGLYYISSSLNEIILAGKRVMHFIINSHRYHSLYAPSKITEYERTLFTSPAKENNHLPKCTNVIIPAAGEGSRFAKEGWKKPKPFIDVNGMLMLEHVVENVRPSQGSVTVLLREEHIINYPEDSCKFRNGKSTVMPVKRLTEGTASTVLLANRIFNNDQPMLVANSDQLVDFDVNKFIEDCFQRSLDGSILVFRDKTMDTKWSYVRIDDSGRVLEVAEKEPISDLATVGIYLFARGKDFVQAAMEMIVANDRVNGEFYTCPVYNYMIKSGAKIGIYEVPFTAMVGLGTPDDLKRYLSAQKAKPSLDSLG